MPATLKHSDVGRLMGSWPFTPEFVTGTPSVNPGALLSKALIMGVVKEPVAGYDVGGRSFDIWIDGDLPANKHRVTFTGTVLSLDDIITVMNNGGGPGAIAPAPGFDIAFRDNGYLRIEPGTSLRISSDPNSSPTDVLFNLGLFPEVSSEAGAVTPALTFDPDRQVMLPNQMTVGEGEDLQAKVFNRMAFQLGASVDRQEGLLSRKRVAAMQETSDITYADPGGGDTGYQFVGDEYVFLGISPLTPAELEKHFAILDPAGNEITVSGEVEDSQDGCQFFPSEEGKMLRCVADTPGYFQPTDTQGNVYLRVSGIGGTADPNGGEEEELNGQLLKITKYLSGSEVLATPTIERASGEDAGRRIFLGGGDGVLLPDSPGGGSDPHEVIRVVITETKVIVTDVKDAAGGTSIVATPISRLGFAAEAISGFSRTDLNNRLVIDSAGLGSDFVTAGVEIGDLLTWANSVGAPFDNDGVYRVGAVVDKETLELVSEDWGSVLLNPDMVAAGDITITSDGVFSKNPFLEFNIRPDINRTSQDYRILYKGMTNLRTAMDDPSVFGTAGSFRYKQETGDFTMQALKSLIGPSAKDLENLQATYFDDARFSMEDIYSRLQVEHWDHREEVLVSALGLWNSSDLGPSALINEVGAPTVDFVALGVRAGDSVTLDGNWNSTGTYIVSQVQPTSINIVPSIPSEYPLPGVGTTLTIRRSGPPGGHKDIRPRTIELDEHIEGPQLILHNALGEDTANKKFLFESGTGRGFYILADGTVQWGDPDGALDGRHGFMQSMYHAAPEMGMKESDNKRIALILSSDATTKLEMAGPSSTWVRMITGHDAALGSESETGFDLQMGLFGLSQVAGEEHFGIHLLDDGDGNAYFDVFVVDRNGTVYMGADFGGNKNGLHVPSTGDGAIVQLQSGAGGDLSAHPGYLIDTQAGGKFTVSFELGSGSGSAFQFVEAGGGVVGGMEYDNSGALIFNAGGTNRFKIEDDATYGSLLTFGGTTVTKKIWVSCVGTFDRSLDSNTTQAFNGGAGRAYLSIGDNNTQESAFWPVSLPHGARIVSVRGYVAIETTVAPPLTGGLMSLYLDETPVDWPTLGNSGFLRSVQFNMNTGAYPTVDPWNRYWILMDVPMLSSDYVTDGYQYNLQLLVQNIAHAGTVWIRVSGFEVTIEMTELPIYGCAQ